MIEKIFKNKSLVLTGIFVAIIFIYGIFSFRNIFAGISLKRTVLYISNNGSFIKGRAKNATELTINGNNTLVDENGYFNEPLMLHNGYNVIHVATKNKFGDGDSKTLKTYVN